MSFAIDHPGVSYFCPEDSLLRIITWNCSAGLGSKFDRVRALGPDILVLQECSRTDAATIGALYLGPPDPRARKGVAILLLAECLKLEPAQQLTPEYQWLLPARIEGEVRLNVLAVWAFGPRRQPSRLHLHQVIDRWAPFILSAPTVVIGDFNNNVQWDTARQPHHRRAVDMLEGLGLVSAYHAFNGISQGAEAHPTLFWRFDLARTFHIDYAFIPSCWRDLLVSVEVGSADDWLDVSDHVPVIVTLQLNADHA